MKTYQPQMSIPCCVFKYSRPNLSDLRTVFFLGKNEFNKKFQPLLDWNLHIHSIVELDTRFLSLRLLWNYYSIQKWLKNLILSIQWGSEYQTSLVFKWSKWSRRPKGPVWNDVCYSTVTCKALLNRPHSKLVQHCAVRCY